MTARAFKGAFSFLFYPRCSEEVVLFRVLSLSLPPGGEIELGASTPLMEASQEGHVSIVRYLIQKGANIHGVTSTGDSALTYACANGHTIIVDILLGCGAELVGVACCLWV